MPYVPKDPELSPEDQKKQEEAEAKLPGIPFPGDFLVGLRSRNCSGSHQTGPAKLIKAGSDLVLQMHYTANGTAGTDISTSRAGVFQDAAHRAHGDDQHRQCDVFHSSRRARTPKWIRK